MEVWATSDAARLNATFSDHLSRSEEYDDLPRDWEICFLFKKAQHLQGAADSPLLAHSLPSKAFTRPGDAGCLES